MPCTFTVRSRTLDSRTLRRSPGTDDTRPRINNRRHCFPSDESSWGFYTLSNCRADLTACLRGRAPRVTAGASLLLTPHPVQAPPALKTTGTSVRLSHSTSAVPCRRPWRRGDKGGSWQTPSWGGAGAGFCQVGDGGTKGARRLTAGIESGAQAGRVGRGPGGRAAACGSHSEH